MAIFNSYVSSPEGKFRFEQALGIQGQGILLSPVALPSEMEQCAKTHNKPTIWGWFI